MSRGFEPHRVHQLFVKYTMIVESVSSIVVAVRDRWKKTVIKEVTDPVTKHEYILTETYYFNRQTKTVPVEAAEKTGNQIDLRA